NALIITDGNNKSLMRLDFPPQSLPSAGAIAVETDPSNFPWGFDPASMAAANTKRTDTAGLYSRPIVERYIAHFDVNHAQTDGIMKQAGEMTIPYPDADNDGFVDAGAFAAMGMSAQAASGVKIRVDTLGLYELDGPTQLWVKVPGAVIDTQQKVIKAPVWRMGLYAIMGAPSNDVSTSYAYPVPFVAAKDDTIKFTNLPDDGEIRIFTLRGELVKQIPLPEGHAAIIEWDVKNRNGEKVGADVYFYQIRSGKNAKNGKIVIVR
ncbi:MAG: T9SS type A sorting domain-containing protein, partial [Elusimicrobia bacterium]|nr:T9SS type A sorting domain-containing protein [Elusimicrobiota bacterium]